MQVLGFRFGIQLLLLMPLAFLLGHAQKPSLAEIGLHLLRGIMIIVAAGLYVFAPERLTPQVADTAAGAKVLNRSLNLKKYWKHRTHHMIAKPQNSR